MQDRSYRIDENLLQHAAGPYIWVRFGNVSLCSMSAGLR